MARSPTENPCGLRNTHTQILKKMEKPINVIESGDYVEPHTFETDREAVLFYSYLEMVEYIQFLEGKLKGE